MSQRSVLVLRPEPGAEETVRHLEQAGISALGAPVIVIDALPESPQLRARIQRLAEFDVVIFVSPAAARIGMQWIDANWPQYPAPVTWLAVGERTQRELEAWDVRAEMPVDARTEGLLALPALAAGAADSVLIVRGEAGREALAETLAERGMRVEHLVVYRRRAVIVELPAATAVAAVVANSGDVIAAFVASGGCRFCERPLVVPSRRVAAVARAAGFATVRVAEGAGPEDTLRALAELGITPGKGVEQ